MPETYLGFPIDCRKADAGRQSDEACKTHKKQKGVSLLIAIMTITIMISFVSDMIISSSVQVELALSSRDKVKAEYLAKSGANLGLFVLSLSHLKDILMASPQVGPLRESPHDGPGSIWNILEGLPPLGASTVDLMLAASKSEEDPFQLKGIMNEKVAAQMRLLEDQFSVKIIDENSKINVNDCAKGNCREVLNQLIRLFSCPVEKAFLEAKNLTPEELAYRIKDFIHDNTQTPSAQSGLEGEGVYRDANPPYGLKNLPLDSVDELKLIAGWDDDLHAVFSPYLTVFPFKLKSTGDNRHIININTIPTELFSCLVPESREPGCAEKFAQKMNKLKNEQEAVATDNAKVKEKLSDLACYIPGEEDQSASVHPEKWFDVYSNVFRIIVKAETGNQQRKLEVVVQRFDPGEEKKDNVMKKLKEQRPYRILYWKLI